MSNRTKPPPDPRARQADPTAAAEPLTPSRGYTVRDLARRFRVSPARIRTLIGRGDLVAVNTADALSAKPRWVILPEALEQFERSRQTSAPPPKAKRKSRQNGQIDFYPDP